MVVVLFFAAIDTAEFLIFTTLLTQILHQKLKWKCFTLWIFVSLIYLLE